MVELTDREKRIVLIKFIMHGKSQFSEMPIEQRLQFLEVYTKLVGLEWNNDEMKDLGDAIVAFQQSLLDSSKGWLAKNQDAVKAGLAMMGTGKDRFKLG